MSEQKDNMNKPKGGFANITHIGIFDKASFESTLSAMGPTEISPENSFERMVDVNKPTMPDKNKPFKDWLANEMSNPENWQMVNVQNLPKENKAD